MGEATGAEPGISQCAERIRLLREYKVATEDYSRAVQVLAAKKGVMKKRDYTAVRLYVNEARLKSESALAELDRHITEHGCGD